MIIFLFVLSVYVAGLLFLRPSPESLKAAPLTFLENFKCIKASLISGLLFLVIFLFTSHYTFIDTDELTYLRFALNNLRKMAHLWPMQSITHLFIHANIIHIIMNVAGLGIASVYERRVGSRRFLAVLIVAGIASIPSIFFYTDPIAISGISGGIFGLGAAYFTDHENLTTKEWLSGIALFAFLVILFSLEGELKSDSKTGIQLQTDHVGHVLGAIGAIAYCRLKKREPEI